jgi:hypothetical protein
MLFGDARDVIAGADVDRAAEIRGRVGAFALQSPTQIERVRRPGGGSADHRDKILVGGVAVVQADA